MVYVGHRSVKAVSSDRPGRRIRRELKGNMTWQEFTEQDPELAALGEERLDRDFHCFAIDLESAAANTLFGEEFQHQAWRAG